jgi:hypothetical protein
MSRRFFHGWEKPFEAEGLADLKFGHYKFNGARLGRRPLQKQDSTIGI